MRNIKIWTCLPKSVSAKKFFLNYEIAKTWKTFWRLTQHWKSNFRLNELYNLCFSLAHSFISCFNVVIDNGWLKLISLYVSLTCKFSYYFGFSCLLELSICQRDKLMGRWTVCWKKSEFLFCIIFSYIFCMSCFLLLLLPLSYICWIVYFWHCSVILMQVLVAISGPASMTSVEHDLIRILSGIQWEKLFLAILCELMQFAGFIPFWWFF